MSRSLAILFAALVLTAGRIGVPISALSAPVLDRHGRAILNIAVHPFRTLTPADIDALGNQLTATAKPISG